MYAGITSPVFHADGNVAVHRELLKSIFNTLAKAFDESLSICAVIPSEPVDEDDLSSLIVLMMSACAMLVKEKDAVNLKPAGRGDIVDCESADSVVRDVVDTSADV